MVEEILCNEIFQSKLKESFSNKTFINSHAYDSNYTINENNNDDFLILVNFCKQKNLFLLQSYQIEYMNLHYFSYHLSNFPTLMSQDFKRI